VVFHDVKTGNRLEALLDIDRQAVLVALFGHDEMAIAALQQLLQLVRLVCCPDLAFTLELG